MSAPSCPTCNRALPASVVNGPSQAVLRCEGCAALLLWSNGKVVRSAKQGAPSGAAGSSAPAPRKTVLGMPAAAPLPPSPGSEPRLQPLAPDASKPGGDDDELVTNVAAEPPLTALKPEADQPKPARPAGAKPAAQKEPSQKVAAKPPASDSGRIKTTQPATGSGKIATPQPAIGSGKIATAGADKSKPHVIAVAQAKPLPSAPGPVVDPSAWFAEKPSTAFGPTGDASDLTPGPQPLPPPPAAPLPPAPTLTPLSVPNDDLPPPAIKLPEPKPAMPPPRPTMMGFPSAPPPPPTPPAIKAEPPKPAPAVAKPEPPVAKPEPPVASATPEPPVASPTPEPPKAPEPVVAPSPPPEPSQPVPSPTVLGMESNDFSVEGLPRRPLPKWLPLAAGGMVVVTLIVVGVVALSHRSASEPAKPQPASPPVAEKAAPPEAPPAAKEPAPEPAAAVAPVEKAPAPPSEPPPAEAHAQAQPRAKRGLSNHKVVLEYDQRPSTSTPAPTAPAGADPAALAHAREAYYKGNLRLFAGDSTGAIASYRESLRIYPGYVAGYRGLGLAYAQAGNSGEALNAFRKYLATVPSAKDVPLIKKRIAHLEGRPE